MAMTSSPTLRALESPNSATGSGRLRLALGRLSLITGQVGLGVEAHDLGGDLSLSERTQRISVAFSATWLFVTT
jgi:hypothetical protein